VRRVLSAPWGSGLIEDLLRGLREEVRHAVREEIRLAQAEVSSAPVRVIEKAPALLSVKDVAKFLRVEAPAVRGYIRAGLLEGTKLSSGWVVHPDALARYISGEKAVAPVSTEDQLHRILRKVQG
jgi:hypothetical protein